LRVNGLARRVIRSAGHGSGSVEVTLPASLRPLEGVACRIVLRDGLRPEIILEPDLTAARALLETLSGRLAQAIGLEQRAAFSPADLALGLFPAPASGSRPALAYLDALALTRPAPHAPETVVRVVAPLAQLLAPPAGIAPDLAADFAAACGFALAGHITDAAHQQAADLAGAELATLGSKPGQALHAGHDNITHDACWTEAQPALSRIAQLYRRLSDHPEQRASLDAAWRRGVALEFSGG
jgi:hypothetical protein